MRELMSAIAVLCLLIFSDFGFAQPDSPHEIEATRETYLVAKKREAEIKAKVMPAREAASAIAAKMTAQLSANEAAYDAVAKDYAALRQAILKKYEERVEAAIVPASLTDEYTEDKRRYDLLLVALSKSNDSTGGDRTFRLNMEKRIDALHQQIATARTESDKKVTEVDRQLAQLHERQPALDSRLAEVIALPVDAKLFGQWVAALAAVGKAEGAALDAEGEMAAAFDKYVEVMSKTSPPYPKAVAVSADGKKVYAANWVAKRSAGDTELTQNELDTEAAALPGVNSRLQRDIQQIDVELRERAEERLAIALSMQYLGERMSDAALAQTFYKQSQILGTAIVEGLAVIVEAALTGGTATVERKGRELAEEAAAKSLKAAKIELARESASGLRAGEMDILKNTFDREKKQIYLRTTEEWAYVQGVLPDLKPKITPGQIEFHHLEAAQKKATEIADANTWKAKLAPSWARLVSLTPEAKSKYRGFGTWEDVYASIGAPIKYGVNRPKPEDKEFESFLSEDSWKSVAISDGLELALNRGFTGGVLQGKETLEAMSFFRKGSKLAISGIPQTGWQQLRGSIRYKNFTSAFTTGGMGYLIAAVSTGTKAAITAYLGAQEEKALRRWTEASAELETKYCIYKISLDLDQSIWGLQQEYRRQRAQNLGRLSEMRKPRELKVEVNQPVTNHDATLGIEMQFSTFLSKPPIVTLGGVAVPMKPDGPPESSDRWSGSVAVRKLSSGAGEAPMTIALGGGNKPFGRLDSVAATPAYMENVSDGRWTNYESGLDTQHKVLLRSQPKGLYERALATLTAVETEMQALREGDMKELLTREWHDGRGFHPYTRADLPFGYSVGSSFDDRDRLVDLKAEIAELKQIHQDQLSGKLSGEKFAERAYEMVWGDIKALWEVDRGTACGDVYALAADRERAEGKLGDERDQTEDRLRKKYTADADEYAAGMEQLKQRQSATRKTQFDPYAKRYQAVAHRLEDRCKRWTPELLRWRDFARQSSAAQDDVHANAMHGFEKTIGDNFSQEALDGLKTGYFTFDTQCGGEPWCKAGLYPDIQTDKDYPAGFGMDNIVVPYVPERPR